MAFLMWRGWEIQISGLIIETFSNSTSELKTPISTMAIVF
jgi:hypothetical protein